MAASIVWSGEGEGDMVRDGRVEGLHTYNIYPVLYEMISLFIIF
jgi:hypothetical protein